MARNIIGPSVNVDRLIGFYKSGYLELLKIIQAKNVAGLSVTQKTVLLAQVDKVLKELDEGTKTWIEENIPTAYREGADQMVAAMIALKQPVTYRNFSQLHKKAIEVMASDTYLAFGEALKTVKRDAIGSVNLAQRQEIVNQLAQGAITGKTRKEITADIEQVLARRGIVGLEDKRGTSWQLDRYAEMLTRTKTMEAYRVGGENRAVENNRDLMIVSDHGDSCPLCANAQRKVYSISGKTPGYPTLQQLKERVDAPHLFGPNCRHTSSPYIPALKTESEREAAKIDDYKFKKGFQGEEIKPLGGDPKKIYRAVDSKNGEAVMGEGFYFAFDKENVKRYGKNIKEFTLSPDAKMLNLTDPTKLEKFTQEAIRNNPGKFEKYGREYGPDAAISKIRTDYAKGLGYQGVIGDDQVFGSVIFGDDKSKLIK